MEYFKVLVKINDKEEAEVGEIHLLHLPRIGEHLNIKYGNKTHMVVINDIWHFVGDDKVGHRIVLYVNHITPSVI